MAQTSQDESLRQRLGELVNQFSHSEIARRTGLPRSSVGHYLQGRKIPASLCANLIDVFNLSPEWLMSGKGAMLRAEVKGTTAHMASEMLDVVNAMNASLKMRLGAIQSDNKLKTLRALKEQLSVHGALLNQVRHQIDPVFSYFLDQLNAALKVRDLRAAARALEVLDDLADLLSDEETIAAYQSAKALFLGMSGRHAEAIPVMRKIFARQFAQGRNDEAFARQANNLIAALGGSGRYAEARVICNATIPCFRGQTELYGRFLALHAYLDANCGSMRRAIRYVQRSHRVTPFTGEQFEPMNSAYVHFLAGTHDVASLNAIGRMTYGKAGMLVSCACLLEDATLIEAQLRELEKSFKDDGRQVHARELLKALKGRAKGVDPRGFGAEEIAQGSKNPLTHFIHNVTRAQVFKVAKCYEDASRATLEAQTWFGKLKRGVQPSLIMRVIHARNAIQLAEGKAPRKIKALAPEARRFFRRAIRRGYSLFRTFPECSETK